MPLIMITGQKPIKKSKQGQFQIIDVVGLFEPICKMSKQIVHGNTIPALVREAFRLAEEERPRAVLLELPEDNLVRNTWSCTSRTCCFIRHDGCNWGFIIC